ncbi:MAG: hypothetical protein KDD37_03535 [Bdellovibrionales bacterium]|nr:hypothetical protein [Bdellovibrionales bacterium]
MAFLLFSMFLSLSIASPTLQSVGGLQGHLIRTADGRSFKLTTHIDFGYSGDIYQAVELTPGADTTPKVIKMLDIHNESDEIEELLRNFRTAKEAIPSDSNTFLNFEYLLLASKGIEADAALLMPQISSSVLQEVGQIQNSEQRVRLAQEVLLLYLSAAKDLISGGYSHGGISLSDVGRMPDGNLRIFDFDHFQRVGNKSLLPLSYYDAPEVSTSGRTSVVSDIYSMGFSLLQILIPKTRFEYSLSITEVVAHFEALRGSIVNSAQEVNLSMIQVFTLASLEKNPIERRKKMIEALQVLQSNTALPVTTRRVSHDLLITLEKYPVRSGFFHSVGLFCRDLFGR